MQIEFRRHEDVDALCLATRCFHRPVDCLIANLGGAAEQRIPPTWQWFDGALYLIQRISRDMLDRGVGRIIIVRPNGARAGPIDLAMGASLDTFCLALRDEVKGTGVTVTMADSSECLLHEIARSWDQEERLAGREKSPVAFLSP